jgi:hypothetical protein
MKIFILFLISSVTFFAQTKSNPEVKGFIRFINEWSVSEDKSNFDLLHARADLRGLLNDKVGYRLYFDVARNSRIDRVSGSSDVSAVNSNLLLDAYITIKPVKNLLITAGQTKVPFSSSNLKSPFSIDFINRPFTRLVTPNLRDVGIKASLSNDLLVSNTISLGIFNGEGDNSFEESKKFGYAFRWMLNPVKPLSFGANYYTGNMRGNIANIYGLEFSLSILNSTLYGEYVDRKVNISAGDLKEDAYFVAYKHSFSIDSELLDNIKPTIRFQVYNSPLNIETKGYEFGLILSSLNAFNSEIKLAYEYRTIENVDDDSNTITLLLQTKF